MKNKLIMVDVRVYLFKVVAESAAEKTLKD